MKQRGVSLQYACFSCRKSFKRPQFHGSYSRFMTQQQRSAQEREAVKFEVARIYRCPDCGGAAHFMGIDFRAPKKTDVKGWAAAEAFIRSGKVFTRGSRPRSNQAIQRTADRPHA